MNETLVNFCSSIQILSNVEVCHTHLNITPDSLKSKGLLLKETGLSSQVTVSSCSY